MVVLMAVSSCGGGDSAGGGGGGDPTGPLTWVSYGGAFQDDQIAAWQEPATERTGITFENVSPYDNAQLQAMVEAGNVVWDITTPGGTFNVLHCGELFEELDPDVVKPEDFVEGTQAGPCSAPVYVYGNIFSYDADVFTDEVPTEADDFFDTKRFPGPRVIYDSENVGLLEFALYADGVAPEDMYPLDLDRAFDKLDTIRDSLIFAPTLGAASQMLVDGQAVMTQLVTARTITTVRDGVNLQPVWDFTSYGAGTLAIPKGSPNAELANEAIAAVLTEDSAIAYAERTGTAPALVSVTPDEIDYDEDAARFNIFSDEERGTIAPINEEYWAEHYEEITKRWNSWKVS